MKRQLAGTIGRNHRVWAAKRYPLAWYCPKCHTLFEYNGKHYPNGILCPECRDRNYGMVGVLHLVNPIRVARRLGQSKVKYQYRLGWSTEFDGWVEQIR